MNLINNTKEEGMKIINASCDGLPNMGSMVEIRGERLKVVSCSHIADNKELVIGLDNGLELKFTSGGEFKSMQ